LVAILGATALFAWWHLDDLNWWEWDQLAASPPSASATAEISRCKAISWETAVSFVASDSDSACGEDWAIVSLGTALTDHPERTRWITDLAERFTTPAGARFRIALALEAAGAPSPELRWYAGDPAVPAARRAWWLSKLAREGAPPWLDPRTASDLSVWRLAHGLEYDDDDLVRAAWAVNHPFDPPADTEAIALNALGVDLDVARSRIASHRSLNDLPTERSVPLRRHISACDTRGATDCLLFLLELLDRPAGPDEQPEADLPPRAPPQETPLAALWTAEYDGRPERVEAAEREWAAWETWASQSATGHDLLRLVFSESGDYGPEHAKKGEVGDPLQVVRRRAGSPWAVALAAQELGAAAHVPVRIGMVAGQLQIQAGDEQAAVGPCGAHPGLALDAAGNPLPFEAWPPEAVLARAALEAAGSAAREGSRAKAVQLAALSARLDPTTASATSRIDSALPPEMSMSSNLGRQAGSMVAWPSPRKPPSPSRSLAELAATDPRCPGLLGP
jgi:hypothetical protein